MTVIPVSILTKLETICQDDKIPDTDNLYELLALSVGAKHQVAIFLDGIDEALEKERKTIVGKLKGMAASRSTFYLRSPMHSKYRKLHQVMGLIKYSLKHTLPPRSRLT
jgi:hypothetical protein